MLSRDSKPDLGGSVAQAGQKKDNPKDRINNRPRSLEEHSLRRQKLLGTLTALVLLLVPTPILAAAPLKQLPVKSTSSRLVRLESLRSIPFEKLTGEAQRKIEYVVAKPTLFRRITTRSMPCDSALFLFLARHPEVVISVWELMGVTDMRVSRTSDHTLHVDDGQGTISSVELLYGTPNTHIVHADGVYEGPLFGRTLYAKCVFILTTQFTQSNNGRDRIVCQLDIFARLENIGADLMAKTLRPVVARMADYTFSESTRFVSQISEAAATNGPGVQRLARRLNNVDPSVQKQFAQLTAAISDRATHKVSVRSSDDTSIEVPASGSEFAEEYRRGNVAENSQGRRRFRLRR